jgi:hypothetical protein
MTKAGEQLIEAVALANGEQPAAGIFFNGHHYVPREAVAAERERCARIIEERQPLWEEAEAVAAAVRRG